ncbi:uncharacterized protein DSM5745_04733 [Aspergillus mulundensis]|uniref:Uncharacterized protein n=1 Tax=Aspergillus mulundensis TaxID=1810919 RepID=A0A3D8S4J8_9EURO|nr:Uncharacterized protein DSM5745_04733 [Aspergillus mulundensis]RDW81176.1 Uncharacterized protein DSM5745_04733 [Aspergillus mulundensis]
MLFANLPEELLWHIFTTYFERDSHTLALLATLNKRFHRITTPILYSHVTLSLDNGDESRNVRRFIMSVFSSPYLAQCVRSLELNELSWATHQSLSRRRRELVARMMTGNILGRPDRLDMFKLVTVVRRLPLSDKHKHKWCAELQEVAPSLDALVALILVFLSSLEKLESNCHWGPIRRNVRDDGVKIQATGLESGRETSSITHLELRYCNIDMHSLQTILKYCRSVRTFIFHRDWDPRFRVRLSGASITEALRPLWETLENVALSFEPCIYLHQEGEIHPLDFSHFSTLTNIYVAAGYLIHDPEDFDIYDFSKTDHFEDERELLNAPLHDRLPESLEVLRITGFSTPQQLEFLIEDCCGMLQHRSRFPRLRELSIEVEFGDVDVGFNMRTLQEEAHRADVVFRKIDITDFSNHDALPTPAGCDWGMNGEFRWSTKLV